MKRSRHIRLVLIGGLSAGALGGCSPSGNRPPPVSLEAVYTNDYYVPGVGYYHAPYRAWFPYPYNHFDPQRRLYYHGGQWAPAPHASITNISAPTAASAQQAEATRTDVTRGGFGSSSRSFSTYS